jgi:hypothetical protein
MKTGPLFLVLRSMLIVATIAASLLAGRESVLAAPVTTPDAAVLPELAAPFGLGSVAWPQDNAGIERVFAVLPFTLAGESRQPVEYLSDRVVAQFGESDPVFGPPLQLTALSFADGDFFPTDFTAGTFVATASSTDDFEALAYGRDGEFAWIQTETTVGVAGEKPGTPTASRTLYTLSWGVFDSPWLYSAAASTPDGLDALVTAAVTAAQTDATPVPA